MIAIWLRPPLQHSPISCQQVSHVRKKLVTVRLGRFPYLSYDQGTPPLLLFWGNSLSEHKKSRELTSNSSLTLIRSGWLQLQPSDNLGDMCINPWLVIRWTGHIPLKITCQMGDALSMSDWEVQFDKAKQNTWNKHQKLSYLRWRVSLLVCGMLVLMTTNGWDCFGIIPRRCPDDQRLSDGMACAACWKVSPRQRSHQAHAAAGQAEQSQIKSRLGRIKLSHCRAAGHFWPMKHFELSIFCITTALSAVFSRWPVGVSRIEPIWINRSFLKKSKNG